MATDPSPVRLTHWSDEHQQLEAHAQSICAGTEPVAEVLSTVIIMTTLPVQSMTIVVVGSSNNLEPLVDSRRPLKYWLDLTVEIETPNQPLDGASCVIQSSVLVAALDTTPQS